MEQIAPTALPLGEVPDAGLPGAGLLFGLLLVAAILGGHLAHIVRIPRVVGYLLGGVALKLAFAAMLGIDPTDDPGERLRTAAAPLRPIKELGLGMILFSIGGAFDALRMRAGGRRLLKIAVAEGGTTFILVLGGALLVGFLASGATPISTIVAFALLAAFAAIATAPAATLFVLREYDAKGPTTNTILSLTGINNAVCIVGFHCCFSILLAAGFLSHTTLPSTSIWFELLATSLGSVLLGVILGFIISLLHANRSAGETLLILLATLLVAGTAEDWLRSEYDISHNFLLTSLCMGATFTNIAVDPERLEQSLQTAGRPILVGFFALAGYAFHLADLIHLRSIGVAYVLCRSLGKILGVYWGTRWSRTGGEVRPYLGAALLCQAAVVIGLADFVDAHWQHSWADRFVTVVLGSVILFELVGPIVIKWTVKTAGEVKAVTLLRRAAIEDERVPGLTLTWQALLRTFGLARATRARGERPLLVQHIMRSNIKTIPADANLDEVLRIVEQSRLSHFPVVNERQELLGVIHFSDIRNILYDPILSQLVTAVDLANPDTDAVSADMTMNAALQMFHDGDVGSLPVVEGPGSRIVVGIIEQRDLLRALHQHRSAP